jgi:hypothetical protein
MLQFNPDLPCHACPVVACSAAAAAAASRLLGPEVLAAIRLPSWVELLPGCTTAAAADSTQQHQRQQASSRASLWWASSSSSSQHSSFTNQQWLQALQLADPITCGVPRQPRCDCCGRRLQQQQQRGVAPAACPGCGVALYCSAGCAAKDSRSHARRCRLLQAVSQPGGMHRDWAALTAAAAATAGLNSRALGGRR